MFNLQPSKLHRRTSLSHLLVINMKIAPPPLRQTRRELDRQHRADRKAINAAALLRPMIRRTREKLRIKMKMYAVRKTKSYNKVLDKHTLKSLKFFRIRRKNVPLPFSPSSKRYSSKDSQDSAVHYTRWVNPSRPIVVFFLQNRAYVLVRPEVRNPSAVFLFDAVKNKLQPVRETKSTSFADFIDWDRDTFCSIDLNPKIRCKLELLETQHVPRALSDDRTRYELLPLDIELPTGLSSADLGYSTSVMSEVTHQTSPLAVSLSHQRLPTPPGLTPGLDFPYLPEASLVRPLVISSQSAHRERISIINAPDPVQPSPAADLTDTPVALSSNAAFPHVLSADATMEYCLSATSNRNDSFSSVALGRGEDLCPPLGLYLPATSILSPPPKSQTLRSDCQAIYRTPSGSVSSTSIPELSLVQIPRCAPLASDAPSYLVTVGSEDPFQACDPDTPNRQMPVTRESVLGEQQGRMIGARLATLVSSSSSQLLVSLHGNTGAKLPPTPLAQGDHRSTEDATLQQTLLNAFLPSRSSEDSKGLRSGSSWAPALTDTGARPPPFVGIRQANVSQLVGSVDCRSAFLQHTVGMLSPPAVIKQHQTMREVDVEMQALSAQPGEAVEDQQRWTIAYTLRSLVVAMATAFLSPWRFIWNVAMRR